MVSKRKRKTSWYTCFNRICDAAKVKEMPLKVNLTTGEEEATDDGVRRSSEDPKCTTELLVEKLKLNITHKLEEGMFVRLFHTSIYLHSDGMTILLVK